jgi:hypothetical protein
MGHVDDASLRLGSTSTNSRSCADRPDLLSFEKKIRWIERALGHGQVARLSDEAGELLVSHLVAIDPEAVNSYFMDGALFNVELFRTHAKRPARNPDLVRVRRLTRTTGGVPFAVTSQVHR